VFKYDCRKFQENQVGLFSLCDHNSLSTGFDTCIIVISIIGKLKRYKSPASNEIPAELIQAGGETLWSEIHKLINSIWNKEELPDQWKESIIVPIHKNDKTDCSNYHGISLPSTSYKIVSNILNSQ
jgi:hypothetical protein